jgi:glucosamine--fructose-6-phosphate aminotransferase (isomerizing)
MVDGVLALCGGAQPTAKLLVELRRILAVLRSVGLIEIRGRDSAGLAVQVVFESADWFRAFLRLLEQRGLTDEARRRSALPDLPALAIAMSGDPEADDLERLPTVTFVYKVAAEVGRLGDNVAELSRQIGGDAVLRAALSHPGTSVVALGHTRWASSGVISVPNCHPVDNATYTAAAVGDSEGPGGHRAGRVFVVMNGDVDNHLALRAEYDAETGRRASPRVTTDTKVVALQIEREIAAGATVDDAFRRACQRFAGSCAIGMITDLAPGQLFLSLRGSGQSLYVGLSEDGFFASSEVYGVVEETGRYVKLDGESERIAGDPKSAGEMVVASSAGPRGRVGLRRRGLDGTELPVPEDDVRQAEITTRDVDRGEFEHFFRKEITQASRSAARTLLGRATPTAEGNLLSERILSDGVREHLRSGAVRLMFVVGQGTAAVAGRGFSEYLRRVVEPAGVRVEALPATEMSGFRLRDDMTDTLVVAVTQSGSTADTNRAVDLARKRGARVVAVVNRRNSDITFRADAVVYTSDGRDVEMSVASTKAFYAQIVAGGLLALAVARELGTLDDAAISRELDELCRLPELMQRVLDNEGAIQRAAEAHAPTREHWAVVASGPNQVAAEEVRIKLSELCYKSIAVDTVENKKHIDLSSEPLILVLAAGNPESVLNDVVKDVAIFQAHKALPIVFAHEGEARFDPYASAVVHLPPAPPLSSMVLCALAGHLFGYHARSRRRSRGRRWRTHWRRRGASTWTASAATGSRRPSTRSRPSSSRCSSIARRERPSACRRTAASSRTTRATSSRRSSTRSETRSTSARGRSTRSSTRRRSSPSARRAPRRSCSRSSRRRSRRPACPRTGWRRSTCSTCGASPLPSMRWRA